MKIQNWILIFTALFGHSVCFASSETTRLILDETRSLPGFIALATFVLAYLLVIAEEFIHLRKSKPVVLAAGLIWIIVAILAQHKGMQDIAETALEENLLEYAMLFLFLLVAMTYVNAMEERRVFDWLRNWLISLGLTYRKLFWLTGFLAFFISPIADNLTTALLMCAVVMAVGKDNKKFVGIGCINIVVAANAGGAFSPFGDITTLMVWQRGVLHFEQFFDIFFPALVSYIVPAAIMVMAIPNVRPKAVDEHVAMAFGAKRLVLLFLITIITAICFHNYLHLPPVIGMMTGLAYLKFFGYYLKMKHQNARSSEEHMSNLVPFDIIKKIERAEWDTLLFFYGVMLCVGGLATIGYLESVSSTMYHEWGSSFSEIHRQTPANVIVGLLSAIVDNIPVMYAVLTMHPTMSEGQWLMVTLTAGIGGSLLSVGSAAGVALMGQARGIYTFFGHLKWTWAIFLGYILGILCHIWLNHDTFFEQIVSS